MALTNSQYDTIMRGYDRRQYENYRRQCARTDEIYEKFPRIREIQEAMSACSIRQAERLFDEEPDALEILRQELSSLRAEKEQILKKAGYPWIIWKCSIPVRTVRTPDMLARKNATASGRKRSNFSILPQDFNLCWKKRTFPPCPMTSMMRHRGLPCRPSSGPVRNMP